MESDYHGSSSDALETVLDYFPSKCIFNEEDIDRYILAFSFYLSTGDDAYCYHTNFLSKKHSSFREFLHKAKGKQTQLDEFIMRLKRCKKIDQWVKSNPTRVGEICISIDNFCQGNLVGDISLCDEVSIEGAQRGKNIITVHFCKRTASFFYPTLERDMERAIELFLSLVTDRSEGGGAK